MISYGSLDELMQAYSKDQIRLQFIDNLKKFIHSRVELNPQANTVPFVPIINGVYLDLYDLYSHVTGLGGFEAVTKDQRWGFVASRLGLPSTELGNLVMKTYSSLLLSLEQALRPARQIISYPVPPSLQQPKPTTSVIQPNAISKPQQGYIGNQIPAVYGQPYASGQMSQLNQYATNQISTSIPPKRPMTARPIQSESINSAEAFSERLNIAIRDLNAKEPSIIIHSLNFLSQKTFELTDNYAVQVENCPHLLLSLASLLDVVNPIGNCLFPNDAVNEFVLGATDDWTMKLPCQGNLEYKILALSIEESPFLFHILNILRNLSTESNNELLIASSVRIMRHVVSVACAALYIPPGGIGDIVNAALDLIYNIGGKIDITGRRKQYGNSWLEDQSDTSNKRFLLRMQITESADNSSVQRYQHIMLSLLVVLTKYMTQNNSRHLILKALDIIGRLGMSGDNVIIFQRAPDSFYRGLVDLLCVSVTAIDPLNPYADMFPNNTPATSGPTKRPPALVGGNFFADLNDNELRDSALDTIMSLAQASPALQIRLGEVPNFLKILLRMADTTRNRYRSETMQRAYSLLLQMSQRPENTRLFQTIHSELIMISCSDDQFAELLLSISDIYVPSYFNRDQPNANVPQSNLPIGVPTAL